MATPEEVLREEVEGTRAYFRQRYPGLYRRRELESALDDLLARYPASITEWADAVRAILRGGQ